METKNLEVKVKDYLKRPWKEKHQMNEYGTWLVYGESPEGDLRDPNYFEPLLGTYEGKFIDILKYAVNLDNFYFWGTGGRIKKARQEINAGKIEKIGLGGKIQSN